LVTSFLPYKEGQFMPCSSKVGCIPSLECCCAARAGQRSHSTNDNLAIRYIRMREEVMALAAHRKYTSSWNRRI